jgi:hypothetical protein
LLPPFDTSIYGLDGASDGFLNEIRGEVGFHAEFPVERVPCSCVGRYTFCVRDVRPTEICSTVGAVKELLSRFVEILMSLVGNDKFDGRSTPDLHVSDLGLTVLIHSGVG